MLIYVMDYVGCVPDTGEIVQKRVRSLGHTIVEPVLWDITILIVCTCCSTELLVRALNENGFARKPLLILRRGFPSKYLFNGSLSVSCTDDELQAAILSTTTLP